MSRKLLILSTVVIALYGVCLGAFGAAETKPDLYQEVMKEKFTFDLTMAAELRNPFESPLTKKTGESDISQSADTTGTVLDAILKQDKQVIEYSKQLIEDMEKALEDEQYTDVVAKNGELQGQEVKYEDNKKVLTNIQAKGAEMAKQAWDKAYKEIIAQAKDGIKTMEVYMSQKNYTGVDEKYKEVKGILDQIDAAQSTDEVKTLVQTVERIKKEADVTREFHQQKLTISGLCESPMGGAVIINDKVYSSGENIEIEGDNKVKVKKVDDPYITFEYKGVDITITYGL